jgi:hypothetical protein
MVTVQAPVPVQAPLQPAKTEPGEALWDRVTTVPCVKLAVQVPPQPMPAGLLVTVPVPLPAFATLRGKATGGVSGGGALVTVIVREHEACWLPLVTLTTAVKAPVTV